MLNHPRISYFRELVSFVYQMTRWVRRGDSKGISWFNRLCTIEENCRCVFYVRLDFGSGDFFDPRGSNYFAKVAKWVRMGRILRKCMEDCTIVLIIMSIIWKGQTLSANVRKFLDITRSGFYNKKTALSVPFSYWFYRFPCMTSSSLKSVPAQNSLNIRYVLLLVFCARHCACVMFGKCSICVRFRSVVYK